jgi:hypothetical protein
MEKRKQFFKVRIKGETGETISGNDSGLVWDCCAVCSKNPLTGTEYPCDNSFPSIVAAVGHANPYCTDQEKPLAECLHCRVRDYWRRCPSFEPSTDAEIVEFSIFDSGVAEVNRDGEPVDFGDPESVGFSWEVYLTAENDSGRKIADDYIHPEAGETYSTGPEAELAMAEFLKA